jgi:endonuclease/exonuclease/phosphatase family metal-dependent hydrolase
MKLLTLNTWGGKVHGPLMKFIEGAAGTVDVFCFQEVFSTPTDLKFSNGAKMNLYQDITEALRSYRAFHSPKSKGYDYGGYIGKDVDFGNAIFIKKDIPVLSCEELFDVVNDAGHDWKEMALAKAQLMTVEVNKKQVVICNFHGMWIKDSHKKDTPERIAQSKHLKEKLNAFQGEKILCGDFNLLPEGESIKILENEMKNLIKDFHVHSTRSSLYKTSGVGYADYILVTPGVTVQQFVVLPNEVSDHLALMLDFEV